MYQIVDFLTITHFVFNFILGLYIKNKYITIFVLGVLWELFEYNIANNNNNIKKLLIKYWPIPEKYWAEKNIFNKVLDVIFNMLGYHLGNISNKINKKQNK